MSEQSVPQSIPTIIDGWQQPLQSYLCRACDGRFLLPEAQKTPACPYCAASGLAEIPTRSLADLPQPEQLLPFQLSGARISQSIQRFASGLWFPPKDLTPAKLIERCCYVYLPLWLVDVGVRANWRAEMGFNYQVVSHQDHYSDNSSGWRSRQVTETRQRWEPRLGSLKRAYHNQAAPALEQHAAILKRLGPFQFAQVRAYQADQAFNPRLRQAVYLPDRSREDAWPEAMQGLQAAGGEECRQACGADFVRDFRWSPVYEEQHWTLLLLPVLTTYYTDDEQKRQVLLIHGQSGRISGLRRASSQQATTAALYIAVFAMFLLLATLLLGGAGIFFPPLWALAMLVGAAAIILGVAALVPFLVVWWVNRSADLYSG